MSRGLHVADVFVVIHGKMLGMIFLKVMIRQKTDFVFQ